MNDLIYDWNHDDADNADIIDMWVSESLWAKMDQDMLEHELESLDQLYNYY